MQARLEMKQKKEESQTKVEQSAWTRVNNEQARTKFLLLRHGRRLFNNQICMSLGEFVFKFVQRTDVFLSGRDPKEAPTRRG